MPHMEIAGSAKPHANPMISEAEFAGRNSGLEIFMSRSEAFGMSLSRCWIDSNLNWLILNCFVCLAFFSNNK